MTWTRSIRKHHARTWSVLAATAVAGAICVVGCGDDSNGNPTPKPDAGPGFDSGPRDSGPGPSIPDAGPDAPDTVAAPVFSPGQGTFSTAQNVTITTATAGATIHYTTDGSEPNTTSTRYGSALNIAKTTPLKAIAVKSGVKSSVVQTAVYTIEIPVNTVQPVQFNPNAGDFANDTPVSLLTETAGATICHTLDDSAPTCDTAGQCIGGSKAYNATSPVAITETGKIIKALACKANMTTSTVTSATYTLTAAKPKFSPTPSDSENPSRPVTLATDTSGGVIHYTMDGSTPDCTSPLQFVEHGTLSKIFTEDTMLSAIVCKGKFASSAVVSEHYRVRPDAPSFEPKGGAYHSNQTVNIKAPPGATVCYTKNTTTQPKCEGAVCIGSTELPILVDTNDTTIVAVGCQAGHTQSRSVFAQYALRPEAPAFDPKSGTSVPASPGKLEVAITSEGAETIGYTIDESDPQCAGSTAPNGVKVTVNANTTVKAVGCKPGYGPSAVSQANYPKAGSTAAPAFTPAGGTYNVHQAVAMVSADADRICYTTDNAEPACSESTAACTAGTAYTTPVTVNTLGSVVKAIACKAGQFKSAVTTEKYNFKVGDVVADPAGGNYEIGSEIRFSSVTDPETGVVYHGTQGAEPTDPTCSSPVLANPLTIDGNTTVKVVGCKDGYSASNVQTLQYRAVTAHPAFTPGGGTYADEQTVTIDSVTRSKAGAETKICYTLDGSAPGCEQSTHVCSGPGDVQGGAAPLAVRVNASAKLRAVACVNDGKFPTSTETSASYTLSAGAISFAPAAGGPFTNVIPKIEIKVANATATPRVCWSSTQTVLAADCLAAAPPSGVHCVDASVASLDNAGRGFDSDTTLNAVACNPKNAGVEAASGGASYDFTPYTHAITIDGANDFAPADAVSTSHGATAFASWDDTYVYLALRGEAVAPSDRYLSVYLSGTGGVKTGLDTGVITTPTALPFDAKYHFRRRMDGQDARVRFYNGTAWIDAPFQVTPDDVHFGGAGAESFVEVRIRRTDLGNPSIVDVAGTIWKGETVDAWPAANDSYLHVNFGSVRTASQAVIP